MGVVLSRQKIIKRQIWQSALTLLLFCATFFSHSEHYAQVEFEVFSTFEQHDCHLCQHGIDTPPNSIKLSPISIGRANINKVEISDLVLISPAYFSPQLRAPPRYF